MLRSYPLSDYSTPQSDKNAKPCKFRKIVGEVVIRVESAAFRGAGPFSGVFELVYPGKDPRSFQNKHCAEVVCAWHGTKPLTSYPHIQILSKYEIIEGCDGEVVDDIA